MARQEQSIDFILELAAALHRYGTPAHHLESALASAAEQLGLHTHVFSTPTSIMIGFGEGSQQKTSLIRMDPGAHNLEKLRSVDELAESVLQGDIGVEEAVLSLRAIHEAPDRIGPIVATLAFPFTTAAATTILGGSWADMLVAAISGFLIGVLAHFVPRTTAGGRLFELIAATLAGATAHLASTMSVGVTYETAMLSSIIVLVPGLTLTIAMTEIATRNLVSGTARLTAAMVVFLEIIFGVALSQELLTRFVGTPQVGSGLAAPEWVGILALGTACVSIAVMFRAHPKALPIIVFTAVCGFLSARFGTTHLAPELGACLGGFVASAIANAYARLCNRSALVALVPGLILLVPGSMGFRSLSSLWEQDVVAGIDTAFKMVIVAISLVAGILVANAVVLPRRSL
ncbi:MAG: threonine/serine exporter family protein [Myxococcales bacterium]|nr:threonine/serine exporter family protein [Myxococcales bacterium]